MYTDILRRIAGIEVFPVVSLLLFVSVFTIALVWTVRMESPVSPAISASLWPAAARLARSASRAVRAVRGARRNVRNA